VVPPACCWFPTGNARVRALVPQLKAVLACRTLHATGLSTGTVSAVALEREAEPRNREAGPDPAETMERVERVIHGGQADVRNRSASGPVNLVHGWMSPHALENA